MEQREGWHRKPELSHADRLIFLDETWVKTNMTRLRGRAPKGERLIDKAPHGHWMTQTFLAALFEGGLIAPCIIDGAINGEMFLEWTRQFLAPELKPGDLVVMDNLSSHKVNGVREAIEATGAKVLYLPPYSPDLNPIEKAFSKLKALLRKYGERRISGLQDRIGELIDQFTPRECLNFVLSCNYHLN